MSRFPVRPIEDEGHIVRVIRNKWIQSGLAGIPFAGGPIQAFLAGVVAEIDQQKWEAYWRAVEDKLEELDASKIDAEYFSSADFVVRLRSVYGQVIAGADEAKLTYLRDYMVACATEPRLDITWRDLFLRHLQEMTGGHIVLLNHFYSRQRTLSHKDRFDLPQRVQDSPIALPDLPAALNSADRVLCELLASDLAASGLLGRWSGSPAEPIAWSITDSGLRLMQFLDV